MAVLRAAWHWNRRHLDTRSPWGSLGTSVRPENACRVGRLPTSTQHGVLGPARSLHVKCWGRPNSMLPLAARKHLPTVGALTTHACRLVHDKRVLALPTPQRTWRAGLLAVTICAAIRAEG